MVAHYDSEVKNVTLFYHKGLDPKFISIPMKKTLRYPSSYPFARDIDNLLKENNFTLYQAQIPIFLPKSSPIHYYVKSIDSKGNGDYSEGLQHSIIETPPTQLPKDLARSLNEISLFIEFMDVNAKNLTAEAKIRMSGKAINKTSFDSYEREQIFESDSATVDARLGKFDKIHNKFVQQGEMRIPLSISGDINDMIYSVESKPHDEQFSLIGDPSAFPFDHYSVVMPFIIPFKNANVDPIVKGDQLINGSWIYSYASKVVPTSAEKNVTVIGIKSIFDRNYSIAAVAFPLLAIFYLLGSIFMLDTTIDQLAIRVAITLGIFAFLFTFVPIINETKPPTLNNVPTLADSLITLLVVGTIGFTISSVLSNSLTLQNIRTWGQVWIDRIMFMIISSFVIAYLLFSHYPTNILIWVTPVVIVGLGYGLLLRMSGLRIRISSKHGLHELSKNGMQQKK